LNFFSVNHALSALPSAIIFGGIIYIIFSNLFVPLKVSAVIISIVMSILIFSLTVYYGKVNARSDNMEKEANQKEEIYSNNSRISLSNISFICLYAILIVFVFLSEKDPQIFVPWEQITGDQIIRLVAAILISLFAPGYAIINILDKKHKLRILPKLLFVYILSLLVTGLIGYTTGFSGLAVSGIQILIGSIHLLILSLFVLVKVLDKEILVYNHNNIFNAKGIGKAIYGNNKYKLLVFASLFALVVFSTYYLYGGKILGDQWFHHGRSLLFLSGTFRDVAVSRIDDLVYPPFEHAFLATFTAISSVPSVNAFASISFLNIIPVFAFYYFFSRWVPSRYKKATLLASTLFMLSSGFGWLYALNLNASNPSSFSTPASALESLTTAGAKTFDIWVPNTFIDVGHPDITTALIIMALPAGFVLLGLIKEENTIIGGSRLKYFVILAAVSILGYLSHDEFGVFLIVASVVPIIFVLKEKNDVFIAILIALSITIFFAYFFPGSYYLTREFLGVPLIFLYYLFAIFMWILYKTKAIQERAWRQFRKLLQFRKLSDDISKTKTLFSKVNIRLVLGVAIVSIIAYLYALSFIIWYFQLPQFDIRVNTLGFSVVPWHLYPLRLGITGLIGLSFLLSYIFKRFEKEIFIFGLIAIVAFLTLPQYLEFRSNKYIMAAMDAFAALMLFKIFFIQKKPQHSPPRYHWKTLVSGFLIGLVVTSSSVSTLMYVGYSELGLKSNPLLKKDVFDRALGERTLPSDSEIHLLNFLNSNINLRHDENIALTAKELSVHQDVLSTLIEGFLGIPLSKTAQSKLALEESSLEGFYKLLDYTNTRYIVLKKSDLDKGVSNVLRFALENFKRPYEDNKYIVLSVPELRSPLPSSSEGDVALIFQSLDNYNIPLSFNKTLDFRLFYPNSDFQSYSKGLSAILKSRADVWYSTTTKENPNYIESSSKTIAETNATDSHHGITWYDGFKTYYAFLRPDRVVIFTPDKGEIASAPAVHNIGKWGTLKIVYINGMINLFLDNVLKIQIPQVSKNFNISKVGLRAWNNIAEFLPVRIGRTWPPLSYTKEETIQFGPHHKYDYYYSLSALSLSKIRYDIFAEHDFSAFSRKNIVLTSDPADAKPYLDYIKNGGTIILLNSNNDFRGGFGNDLLCIKPLNETRFNSITNSVGDSIKVSGISRNIGVHCPNSTTVKSFYMSNDKRVAPFAVEKEYGKGRIIFVNFLGYFESILKYPKKYFTTLGNLSSLINLKLNKFNKPSATLINIAPIPYFAGNLTMSGQVTINASSLLLGKNNNMVAERISILNQTNSFHKSHLSHFNNVHIRDLKIYGSYNVTINSSNLLYMPSSSQYNYIPITLPYGSNMTINLSNDSRAEMRIGEGTNYNNKDNNSNNSNSNSNIPIQVLGGSRIELNKINDTTAPLLVKSPEIKVTGKTAFQQVRSHYPDRPTKPWTDFWPLQVYGKTIIRLDHVSDDATDVGQHVTYFKWIEVNTNTAKTNNTSLVLSGEILKIPWQQVMSSYFNTRTIVTLIIMAAVALYIAHSSPKVRKAIG
jgi:hypothetical protein